APKALLTIPRNRCSRSSEISAHDPLKSALTIPRNAHPSETSPRAEAEQRYYDMLKQSAMAA
ncbi:hypothetical protein, partial [Bradyrhizobium sp. Mp27]|uniref:hypothetical protein n=1 Tax=Bradyrhizobium sp. Mp27 TaxID=3042157 RepID=UPI00248C1405